SAPQFYNMVKDLAARAELPMPRVYLIDEDAPNAFATGRNPEHAAVAATTGILRVLNERELRGVMAHELTHVKHRDILISTISATMAGAVSALANFAMFFGGRDEHGRPSNPIATMAVALLAPLAAMLIQMAISRAREFEADRGGAEISGDPRALASALDKIHRYAQGIPLEATERHPETAQMMIMNPLSGGGLRGLFSTHPATEERVQRLLAMAGARGGAWARARRCRARSPAPRGRSSRWQPAARCSRRSRRRSTTGSSPRRAPRSATSPIPPAASWAWCANWRGGSTADRRRRGSPRCSGLRWRSSSSRCAPRASSSTRPSPPRGSSRAGPQWPAS